MSKKTNNFYLYLLSIDRRKNAKPIVSFFCLYPKITVFLFTFSFKIEN